MEGLGPADAKRATPGRWGFECSALGDRSVHVWYVGEEALRDESVLERCERLLAPSERAQQQRFVNADVRREYLVTRALVRSVLSLYRDIEPEQWCFRRNPRGRPEVSGPGTGWFPRFNLSNTRGLVACAVTRSADVGIDVEDTKRPGATVSLAERFFSTLEVRSLRCLPQAERRRRFFEYWTLGEAYIKARGLGLAIPLEAFSFHLDEGPEIGVDFDSTLGDRAEDWQFRLYRLPPSHQMALAVRRGNRRSLDVRLQRLALRGRPEPA